MRPCSSDNKQFPAPFALLTSTITARFSRAAPETLNVMRMHDRLRRKDRHSPFGERESIVKSETSLATMAMIVGLALAATPGSGVAQDSEAPRYGPPSGSLIIDGGNASSEVRERFIELGGGAENGRFVIVPTGGGNRDVDGSLREYQEEDVIRGWVARGVKNVRMLHTADRSEADTEAFIEPLLDATGVWFAGGRQWNYVDSYADTRTLEAFHEVLGRGGVIGGGSAGASIQGEYLVRGDSRNASIVMTDEPEHQSGFAFLKNSAIDQHINTRNRWDDLVPVIERFPNLLGIGLSEGTAIEVTGDVLRVLGVWKVAVHDNTRVYQPWEKPYYVLSPGDVYNMATRSVVAHGNGGRCAAPTWPTGWVTVPMSLLEQYVGSYPPMTVLREGAQLIARMPAGVGELVPVSDTEFMIEEVGVPVRFERGPDGEISGVVMRQNCTDRFMAREGR